MGGFRPLEERFALGWRLEAEKLKAEGKISHRHTQTHTDIKKSSKVARRKACDRWRSVSGFALRATPRQVALGWRRKRIKVKGQRNVKSEKIEGVLALHTFPLSQFLTFFPLGGRRSAVFWRAGRIRAQGTHTTYNLQPPTHNPINLINSINQSTILTL
jgi:hypothetical protein